MRKAIFSFCLIMTFIQAVYGSNTTIRGIYLPDVTKNIVVQKGCIVSLDPAADIGAIKKWNGDLKGLVKTTSYKMSDNQAFHVKEKIVNVYYDSDLGRCDYGIYTLTALKAGNYKFYGDVTYVSEPSRAPNGHIYNAFLTGTVTYIITVIDVTSVNIPSSLSLKTGDYYVFNPVITDSRCTTTFSWTSDNSSVASINNGTLTARSAGTAHITCNTANGKSATCTVTVTNVPISQIILPSTSIELTKGATYKITSTIIPSNATNQELTWSTSNSSVVAIHTGISKRCPTSYSIEKPIISLPVIDTSTCEVRAVGTGTAMVTGYATDGSGVSVTCKVTVSNPPEETKIFVEEIKLEGNEYQCLNVDDTSQLTATIQPSNATNKSVTWSSSNTLVATVTNNGFVKAVGIGSATVRCTANDGSGVTATCVFDVVAKPVMAITLFPGSCNLEVDKTQQLTATIEPANATNKGVRWESSNPLVATVNINGIVTAKSPGASTIVCEATDGSGVSGTCVVTVTPVMVKSIVLTPSTIELQGNEQYQLTAAVMPTDAANKNLRWISSDNNVASVDESGLVSAVGNGEAIVTCEAQDGSGVFATSKVTVSSILVESIKLSPSSYTNYYDNNTIQLTATVMPEYASNRNVIWSSSNNNVATVDNNGFVTAMAKGTATISCTAVDNGGATGICEVNIITVYPEAITIEGTSHQMDKGDKLQLKYNAMPAYHTYYGPKWSSSNQSVATVDANGLVTAVGTGTTTITCTLNSIESANVFFRDPYEKTATYTITVSEDMSPKAIIPFADNLVKSICVSQWDKDGDGELSYEEAAAVTSLNQVFRENLDIEQFRELQYFTGLTSIGEYDFSFCVKLSEVVIPQNVKSIESAAFWHCIRLTSIEIPESVNIIGGSAFGSCPDRNFIKVASGNKTFDSRDGCNAIIESETNTLILGCSSTVIPQDIVAITFGAFHECNGLQTIEIGNHLTNIEDGAFLDCADLENIIVDGSNAVYDSRNGCNAIIKTSTNELITGCQSTVIPDDVVAISAQAFRAQRKIANMFFPSNVKTIGWQAFNATALKILELPEGLTTIGKSAFYGCSKLEKVELPSTVTNIEQEAFYLCENLHKFVVKMLTPPAVVADALPSCRSEATLFVPAGSKDTYANAEYWNEFKEIVEMTDEEEKYVPTSISPLADAIFADDISATNEGKVGMKISLKNSASTTAYSFDLVLPNGVSLMTDEDGKYVYTLTNRHNDHIVTIQKRALTDTYSITVISPQSEELKDNDGTIMTLWLQTTENVPSEEYVVKICNSNYSLPSGYAIVAMPETVSILNVDGSDYIKGDVNGDSNVTMTDVMILLSFIFGEHPEGFIEVAADLNNDGKITITDAMGILDIILEKTE